MRSKAEQSKAKHSLSTGASREAPVDKSTRRLKNAKAKQSKAKQSKAKQTTYCPRAKQSKAKQSKAKHSLSTGASREAPVDNESRFNDMFKEKEEDTLLRAAEVMRELGWDATE